ncbi:MAG: hypothetical protein K8R18_08115 [Parvibaculum sp.]|uniref:hypothetical protein n=1 Tax=Parvibaculum sp. TaxID=2024848 RepID=UPI0025E6E5E8|nr:hypothetical protein [Parvibaculum sp.]MCE9649571.1 hypothetical protein [Parvibaculum sp.]
MWWTERTSAWRKFGFAACAALCLTACAQEPDLGRYKPSAFQRINAVFSSPERDGAMLPPTDAEVELGLTAANLVSERPAREDDRLASLTNMMGTEIVAPPSLGYYMRLRAHHPTGLTALINAIADDVTSDTMLMEQFAPICERVNDADRERADALVGAPSSATTVAQENPASFATVRARLENNGRLIDTVADTLARRLVSYRTALAHARLDAPVPDRLAVVAEAIRLMDERLVLLERDAVRHQAIEASAAGGASI